MNFFRFFEPLETEKKIKNENNTILAIWAGEEGKGGCKYVLSFISYPWNKVSMEKKLFEDEAKSTILTWGTLLSYKRNQLEEKLL